MTPKQKRGRACMLVAIGTLVAFDLAVKVLLLVAGTLRWPQIAGTAVTLVVCWFLWRGSRVAYGFLILCLALGVLYAALVASQIPIVISVIFCVVLGTISVSLLAPATRSFAEFRRQALAQQGAAAPLLGADSRR